MDSSLKNLSLITIAASFWAKHNFENWYEVVCGSGYKTATKIFCKQVDALELPQTLKAELKLVVVDFGRKKKFATRSMLNDGITLEYANVVRWNGRNGMVDCDKIDEQWKIMNQSSSAIPKFSDDYLSLFERPKPIYVQIHPDSHPLLEYGRLTPIDGSGFVYYWRPCGEQFAGFFISLMDKDKFDNANDLRLAESTGESGKKNDEREAQLLYRFDNPNRNSEVARFVFEVLNEEQRGQIFQLGQSEVIKENDEFRSFFANIFCHWPWQNGAFASYFTSRDEITETDCLVLKEIIDYKRAQEMDILPPDRSFYKRVERFHDTVCRRCRAV